MTNVFHDVSPEIIRYTVGARIDGFKQGYNVLILELEGGRELVISAIGKIHVGMTQHGHTFTPPKQ